MTTGGFPDATITHMRSQLLSAHNRLRSHYGGRHTLSIVGATQREAQAYADKLAASNGGLVHGGFGDHSKAQNIAVGQDTVNGVMYGWRTSCSHFYNMIDGAWRTVGFGISKSRSGRIYWATHFNGTNDYDCFSQHCPACSCNQCGTNHAFFSDDRKRPGGSNYFL